MNDPRKHVLISNAALTQITGIRKVCMDCGEPDPARGSVCRGYRRSDEERRAEQDFNRIGDPDAGGPELDEVPF